MALVYQPPCYETLRGDDDSPATRVNHVYMQAPPTLLAISKSGLMKPVQEGIMRAAARLPRELFSRGLHKWLPEPNDPLADRRILKDAVFAEIKQLLVDYGKVSWSYCPRTFSVLWMMGLSDETIDKFMADGRTDHYLPYNEGNLPDVIRGAKQRARFLKLQQAVRCKKEGEIAALEAGGKHVALSGDVAAYFFPMRNLGNGRFAQVDQVYSCQTTRTYARKMIYRGQSVLEDKTQLAAFEKELRSLKALSHRHVVQLVGSYTHPTHLGLIMSPVADYDLHGFLVTDAVNADDRKRTLRSFFGCLVTALAYIHSKKVRHKDIKPSNILVKDAQVLLADFGTSRICLDGHLTTNGNAREGTPRYWAPEVMEGADRNTASDIWSLGCVFLEMATILFGHSHHDMLRFYERRGTEDPNRICLNHVATQLWIEKLRQVAAFDHAVLDWVSMMLRPKPEERPTAAQLRGLILDTRSQFDYICPECASVDGINASESLSCGQLVHEGRSAATPSLAGRSIEARIEDERASSDQECIDWERDSEIAGPESAQATDLQRAPAVAPTEEKTHNEPPPPYEHEQVKDEPHSETRHPKSDKKDAAPNSSETAESTHPSASALSYAPGPVPKPTKAVRFSTAKDDDQPQRFTGLPSERRPEICNTAQKTDEVKDMEGEVISPDQLLPPPFRHVDCVPLPRASLVPSYVLAGTNHFSAREMMQYSSLRTKNLFVYGRLMFPSLLNALASQSINTPSYSPLQHRRLIATTEDWGKADLSIQRASEIMTPARLKGYDRWRPQGLDCAVVQVSAGYTEKILRRRNRERYRMIHPRGEVIGFLIVGLGQEAMRYLDLLFAHDRRNLSSLNPTRHANRNGAAPEFEQRPEPPLQRRNVTVDVELNDGRVAAVNACTYVWSQGATDLWSCWSEDDFVRGSEFQAMMGIAPHRREEEAALARTMQISFAQAGDILARAILEDDIEALKRWLEPGRGGCDPNAPCQVHGTALQAAVVAGRGDMVEVLLERGAKVNSAPSGRYGTPLIAAACASRKAITRMLLDHGADVHQTHPEHVGALYQAVGHSDYTVAEMLLEHGAWLAEDWGEILDLATEVGDEEVRSLLASYDVCAIHRGYLLASPDRITKIAGKVPYARVMEAVVRKFAAVQTMGGRWRGRKGVAVVAAALNAGAPITILPALRRAVTPVQELLQLLRQRDEMEEQKHRRALEGGGNGDGAGGDGDEQVWELSDSEEDEEEEEAGMDYELGGYERGEDLDHGLGKNVGGKGTRNAVMETATLRSKGGQREQGYRGTG